MVALSFLNAFYFLNNEHRLFIKKIYVLSKYNEDGAWRSKDLRHFKKLNDDLILGKLQSQFCRKKRQEQQQLCCGGRHTCQVTPSAGAVQQLPQLPIF